MKKYLFLILISLIIILFASCPENVAIGTVWKGTIDNVNTKSVNATPYLLSSLENATLEVYFNPDKTIRVFITILDAQNSTSVIDSQYTYAATGDYFITPSYVMGSTSSGNNLFGSIYFVMSGYLNTTNGTGNGDYNLEFQNGNQQGDKYNGTWNLGKVH